MYFQLFDKDSTFFDDEIVNSTYLRDCHLETYGVNDYISSCLLDDENHVTCNRSVGAV